MECNVPLPSFASIAPDRPIDMQICFSVDSEPRKNVQYPDRVLETVEFQSSEIVLMTTWAGQYARFVATKNFDRIRASCWPGHAHDNAVAYFMGPILRLVTVCRGLFGLHGGGVAYGKDAILVVGSQGAGKSTLLRTLGALGGNVFADDLTVLATEGGQWFACSGAREVKLMADALAAGGSQVSMARPQWDFSRVAPPPGEAPKFVVRSEGDATKTRYRLVGIHILGTRSSDLQRSSLTRLGKAEATAQLARHLPVVPRELAHLRQAAATASLLAALATAVPVWTVARPDDLSAVRDTARALFETFNAS
jgi:hypothetical protein